MKAFDIRECVSDSLVLFWDCVAGYLGKWNPELVLGWLVD